jgi:transposase
MSTTLLFHAFGIRGYQYVKSEFSKGAVTFYISQDRHNLRCPVCQSSRLKCRGKRIRKFRSVPIGNKKTFIVLPVQRVFCSECENVSYVKVNFAQRKKRYTRSFQQYALTLLRHSTIQDVAHHLGVGWDLIKELDKADLQKFKNPSLKELKQIAIDEISFGKGHRYITIVLDIESGAVVYIGDGKGSESLDPFWKKLKRQKVEIEAVASDMSPAYISAIETNLSNAVHVTDPFHVVKLFNDKLSDLRRDIYNENDDDAKKKS